jgi:CRP-like cAMP-binding protein
VPVTELPVEQRLRFLQAAVELRDLAAPALLALGEAMQLRSHPVRHVFYGLHDPVRGRALRVLLHGKVALQPGTGEARALARGALFGVEGLVEWIGAQELAPRRGRPAAAHVLDACWTLELAADNFSALLDGPHGAALREHVLRVHEARAHAEHVARELGATPELAGVRQDRLFELGDGARLVRRPADEVLLPAGAIPQAVYLLLAGRLQLTGQQDKIGPAVGVRSGRVFGQRHVLLQAPLPAHVVCATDVELVELSARRYVDLMRGAADVRRAVTRTLLGGGQG